MTPNLGWVEPQDRTKEQQDADDEAKGLMPAFALSPSQAPTGKQNVRLYKGWSDPKVVEDTKILFDRFHQMTGSCVGAGGGTALYTLLCVQRLLTQGATKAFVPWWLHPYGQSRRLGGFRGRGEGSFGSTFFRALKEYGVPDAAEATAQGVKGFNDGDGFSVSAQQEMEWSDGNSSIVKSFNDEAIRRPLGSGTQLRDVASIRTAILNGSPVTWACGRFINSGRVRGSGENACVTGRFDSRGGHQTSLLAVWDHPELGPLYWNQNNWPGSVYPKDPAGGPPCGVWMTEDDLADGFNYSAEAFALSHLEGGVVIQPEVEQLFSWYV